MTFYGDADSWPENLEDKKWLVQQQSNLSKGKVKWAGAGRGKLEKGISPFPP